MTDRNTLTQWLNAADAVVSDKIIVNFVVRYVKRLPYRAPNLAVYSGVVPVYSGVVLAIAVTTGRSYCSMGDIGRTPVIDARSL